MRSVRQNVSVFGLERLHNLIFILVFRCVFGEAILSVMVVIVGKLIFTFCCQ